MSTLKPLITENEIANRVNEIAANLNHNCAGEKNILLISILKGSFIFTADLVRKLTFEFDLAFMEISSYGNSKEPGKIQLRLESHLDLKDKNIFIIEDIIDTGNTINFLSCHFEKKGIKSIEYVTLLLKNEKYKTNQTIKYIGFNINDVFVAGYGMDYDGKYRNLPYIIDTENL